MNQTCQKINNQGLNLYKLKTTTWKEGLQVKDNFRIQEHIILTSAIKKQTSV